MDASLLQALLAWIAAHPVAAGIAIFLVAFIDGLVAVGLLMPSGPILVAVGTLIGLGSVNGPYAIVCAALGALCGDSLSYAFGRHFGQRMKRMWPFSRHPQWLEQAEIRFRRHDIKGVVIGRFVGATRPFIPAIAGMLKMPMSRYFSTAIVTAFVWSVLFISPGWLLGASIDLLLAVAGRLTLVLLILIAVLGSIYFAVSRAYAWLAPHASGYLEYSLAWSHRHPVLGRLSAALIEPNRPESASLLVLAALLILAGLGFFWLTLGAAGGGEPLMTDMLAYEALYGLRTPWADPLMVMLGSLGDLQVLLPASALVFLWLLWRRRHTAAWHWLAAIGFAMVLVVVLGYLLDVPKPPAALAVPGFGFPSEPVAMATVVYGFFAVLIARELPGRNRTWPYVVAGLLVAAVGFARLYFGAHWLSDIFGGITLGMLWVATLGIAYRRRIERSFWVRPISLIFFVTVVSLTLWVGISQQAQILARYSVPELREESQLAQWQSEDWAELPERRNDFSAGRIWAFNVQYAGSLAQLRQTLIEAGWRDEPAGLLEPLLRSLDSGSRPETLPLLPASHNGRPDVLTMSRPEGDGNRRLMLRLWSSPLFLTDSRTRVWQGTVAQVRYQQRFRLISVWRIDDSSEPWLTAVGAALPELEQTRVTRTDGRQVLLLTAPPSGKQKTTPAD